MTALPSPGSGLRESRLRPEAAERCPWVAANMWLAASTLADEALGHGADGGKASQAGRRALPDDAFEFRGGRPELALRSRARTRWSDYPGPSKGSPTGIEKTPSHG